MLLSKVGPMSVNLATSLPDGVSCSEPRFQVGESGRLHQLAACLALTDRLSRCCVENSQSSHRSYSRVCQQQL
jgi:hypothetical protein